MIINYLLLVHKNPKQVEKLVNALDQEQVNFFIHVDGRKEIEPYQAVLKERKNIYFIPESFRVSVTWGNFSVVDAMINVMHFLKQNEVEGTVMVLSGQCYPIKNSKEIVRFLTNNSDINYIDRFEMPTEEGIWGKYRGMDRLEFYGFKIYGSDRVITKFPHVYHKDFYTLYNLKKVAKLVSVKPKLALKLFTKRKFPKYIEPYGGELWWTLPMSTILEILSFLDKHPDYIPYHKDTVSVSEIFFHSIVHSLFPQEKCKPSLMYTNWKRKNCTLPVTFAKDDLDELMQQDDKLFARKFDIEYDDEILQLLDDKVLV